MGGVPSPRAIPQRRPPSAVPTRPRGAGRGAAPPPRGRPPPFLRGRRSPPPPRCRRLPASPAGPRPGHAAPRRRPLPAAPAPHPPHPAAAGTGTRGGASRGMSFIHGHAAPREAEGLRWGGVDGRCRRGVRANRRRRHSASRGGGPMGARRA